MLAGRTRTRTLRASAAAIAALAVAAPGAFAQAADRTVTVVGDATATAPNDTAHLHFSVANRARRATVALAHNSARMRRVIAAVKAAGIPAADIRTQEVGLSRQRIKTHHGKHRRVVYRAVNGIGVTVRHIGTSGKVIDAAVNAGATGVSGIELSSSKVDDLRRQALGDAFDEARAKAETLAEHAGATLGAAQQITEGVDTFNGGNQQNATSGSTGTPIEPGTTKIHAEVTVTFALE